MSYCRMNAKCDVYVYPSGDLIVCQGCRLHGREFIAHSPKQMLSHLVEHRTAGHQVDEWALKRLRREAKDES